MRAFHHFLFVADDVSDLAVIFGVPPFSKGLMWFGQPSTGERAKPHGEAQHGATANGNG